MKTFYELKPDEMYAASQCRDTEYDGVFFLAVKTTGVFCRPACPARMPLQKNVLYFPTAGDALGAGFRPCKKCRPMRVSGSFPDWLSELLNHLDKFPQRKWRDRDIRELGVDPRRVSRWFLQNQGITFHSYLRSRRLSTALARLSVGDDPAQVALDAGFESLSGFRAAFQKSFGVTPGRVDNGSAGNVHACVLAINRILTPLGPMLVAASQQAVYMLEFADRRMLSTQLQRLVRLTNGRLWPGENSLIEETAQQLEQYFNGSRTQFDLPLEIPGSEFQQQVWQRLQKIPYGHTVSYEQIAGQIDRPGGQRAVGRANGENRLAIIIPCHRVIRADGTLSGYGGGLRRKQWLLDLERAGIPAMTG